MYIKMFKMAGNKTHSVLITYRMPKEGPILQELRSSCNVHQHTGPDDFMPREDLIKALNNVDAALIQSEDVFDRDLLDLAGQRLKMIATMSVGVDHINLTECANRNIKVSNSPGVSTNSVAEETIGLLIATARKFKQGMQELCDGTIVEAMVENPYHLSGHEIHGSVVGIVGLGRIGLAVAKRLVPFGISQLLYCDLNPNPLASGFNAEFVSFDELLRRSDYVMCCCSFMQENSKMFNSDAFKKMKKSAVFINTSRGAVVDQDALIDALQNRDIYGAGLDVTTPEPLPAGHRLLTLNNCLVLPHVGGNTVQATSKMADLCAQNILAGLRGEPLLTPVNI